MPGVNRTSFKMKALSGRRFGVGAESEVSPAAALGLAQAKLKIVSAIAGSESGTSSTGLDVTIAANQPGHTDAADGMNLELKDAAGQTRSLHIPQASTSYKAAINDGSVDITNADILAVVAAYNTATGGAWTLVSGRFTSEG